MKTTAEDLLTALAWFRQARSAILGAHGWGCPECAEREDAAVNAAVAS